MASCKCGEIRDLEEEIRRLEETKSLQYQLNQYINETKDYLKAVAVDAQNITESQQVQEDRVYVLTLTDKLEAVKYCLLEKINNKLSNMRDRLSDMREEDEQHHKEEEEAEEDVLLSEFDDVIEGWIIEKLQSIGCDTAKSVLACTPADIAKRADLEDETVAEIFDILRSEFEE